MGRRESRETAAAGLAVRRDRNGPQLQRSSGKRWTAAAEERFLDHLAATCNVRASAAYCGFCLSLIYRKRRADPAFAKRWQVALEQGYARLEAMLVQRANEALEGRAPDPDFPIPPMSVKEAMAVLAQHRAAVERHPRSRRRWARPRTLDEMRDSILAKLSAIAPPETGGE